MPTVSEPVDREQVAGRVRALVDEFQRGTISEYTLFVSLNILFRDRDEALSITRREAECHAHRVMRSVVR